MTGSGNHLKWLFKPDSMYYLVAGQQKYLSFSWKDGHSDSFIVDINLGEAQKLVNFTTYQSNGTGSIFFIFYPD